MQTIKITFFLLTFLSSYAQAQDKVHSKDQSKTIEIDNDNGELFISFLNGDITEFVINDEPVELDRYADYQAIIDDFADEKKGESIPEMEAERDEKPDAFRNKIIKYLMDEHMINSPTKYNVNLTRMRLKIKGGKVTPAIHKECLDIFEEIYGHQLNFNSEVCLKRSKNKSKTSFKISTD